MVINIIRRNLQATITIWKIKDIQPSLIYLKSNMLKTNKKIELGSLQTNTKFQLKILKINQTKIKHQNCNSSPLPNQSQAKSLSFLKKTMMRLKKAMIKITDFGSWP